jgi:hypothetical protein
MKSLMAAGAVLEEAWMKITVTTESIRRLILRHAMTFGVPAAEVELGKRISLICRFPHRNRVEVEMFARPPLIY